MDSKFIRLILVKNFRLVSTGKLSNTKIAINLIFSACYLYKKTYAPRNDKALRVQTVITDAHMDGTKLNSHMLNISVDYKPLSR